MIKTCHTDPMNLFKLGKATIWAGSKAAVTDRVDWSFVVSAVVVRLSCPISTNDAAKGRVPKELTMEDWVEPPVLEIDWPDYSIPSLRREWWQALVSYLRTVEGDVAITCQGGHGRTGTALAIIASLGGVVPKKVDPVLWLRKLYCLDAVESNSQLGYFERITGRKTKAVPPPKGFTGHSYGGVQSSFPGATTPAVVETGNSAGGATSSQKSGTEAEPRVGREVVLWEHEDDAGKYYTNDKNEIVAVEWDSEVDDTDLSGDDQDDGVEVVPVDVAISHGMR